MSQWPEVVGIIPALAGNTQKYRHRNTDRSDHPRSRGEYGELQAPHGPGCGSSPLSRGIHSIFSNSTISPRIIPALAGNTATLLGMWTVQRDHPRSRGEYFLFLCSIASLSGSSPLSRGIPCRVRFCVSSPRIIPALAGNTERTQVS